MTRDAWRAHALAVAYDRMTNADRLAHAAACPECKARARTRRANRSARERNDVMRSLGLVRTPYGWE